MMKRGQQTIGLVLLAIVAILAVIGLVLYFKSPTGFAIGKSYTWPGGPAQRGIAETTPIGPARPGTQYPLVVRPPQAISSSTPALIMFPGDYGNINEMPYCWDAIAFKMSKKDLNCYSVPAMGVAKPATGWFPSTSSAGNKPYRQLGGALWCYSNVLLDREQVVERLISLTKDKGWTTTTVNGLTVAVCNLAPFPFPQGVRPLW